MIEINFHFQSIALFSPPLHFIFYHRSAKKRKYFFFSCNPHTHTHTNIIADIREYTSLLEVDYKRKNNDDDDDNGDDDNNGW